MLKRDDLKFLKNLKEEMVNQDTDCQASPRFWVIRDYEWEMSRDDFYNRISVYNPRNSESYEIIDFIANIEDYYELSKELLDKAREVNTTIFDSPKEEKERICLKWVKDNLLDDVQIVHESSVLRIVPSTFFLTKREAKEHIKANQHHYSKKVHTYAMTAWRSPQVKRLYEILEKTDWEMLKEIVYEGTLPF